MTQAGARVLDTNPPSYLGLTDLPQAQVCVSVPHVPDSVLDAPAALSTVSPRDPCSAPLGPFAGLSPGHLFLSL